MISYTYDAANRLTNVDGVGYPYDNGDQGSLGNLLSDGVYTYTYDTANRLVQVLSGTLTIAFEYDGDGHRTAQVVGGVTTTYVVAVLGLPQVLAETTGGETTRYLYGYGLLGEEGSAWAWHLGDGLNSLRQLAGNSGQVTLAQGYTPFGVPLWSEGNGASARGFTGEQWQADAGLLFLRARYYQPATGRFLSRDPFPGFAYAPVTQQPYAYVGNNPVNWADPAGYLLGWGGGGGTPPPVDPPPSQPPNDARAQIDWLNGWMRWLRYHDEGPNYVTIADLREWRDQVDTYLRSYDWDYFVSEGIDSLLMGLAPAGATVAAWGGATDELAAVCIERNHTVPRQILKHYLPTKVANDPRVRGVRGAPNRWPIPRSLHRAIHRGKGGGSYNEWWIREIKGIRAQKRPVTVDDVLRLRERAVRKFGLEAYRP